MRSVAFSNGDDMFLSVTDGIMGQLPLILLYKVAEDRAARMFEFSITMNHSI